MNLEFLNGSVEMTTFLASCRIVDTVDRDCEGYDDRYFFDRIYAVDGKTYCVECFRRKGIKTQVEFISHNYMVSFVQVNPVEITQTIWEPVE
jgi:hypothetical protein